MNAKNSWKRILGLGLIIIIVYIIYYGWVQSRIFTICKSNTILIEANFEDKDKDKHLGNEKCLDISSKIKQFNWLWIDSKEIENQIKKNFHDNYNKENMQPNEK